MSLYYSDAFSDTRTFGVHLPSSILSAVPADAVVSAVAEVPDNEDQGIFIHCFHHLCLIFHVLFTIFVAGII